MSCFTDDRCSDCNSLGKCTNCHDGYELNANGLCVCKYIKGCFRCNNAFNCTICENNKFLNIAKSPNECIDTTCPEGTHLAR